MENLTYITKIKNTIILVFILLFSFTLNAQNGLWDGSENDDWETSANWDDGNVPDNTVDVTIQSGSTYYPSIDNTGEECKSMTVENGATLTMSTGGSLTINGNFTVGEGSTGIFNAENGTITITGQLILDAGASLTITDCSITCPSTNLNTTSTVAFEGSNISLCNWNYGNLILNGTGTMQITGDATTPTTCNNLTINNTGNILKIPVNKALTVNGTLTNNAGISGIVIESTSSGDGSLISSTLNVNATVNRYITGSRWHYLSSPIDDAPLTLFNTNNFLWWDAAMEWDGTGDYDPWKSYSETYLENGQGYAYYYYEDTVEYKGYMNVSDYTQTLYKSSTGDADDQGWNLVGNPYTSILDWDDAVTDGAVPTGAENAIYFFDDDGTGSQSNYHYYVPSTGGTYGVGTEDATGSVPLGQAFFIKTNTNNVTLSFKNDYRIHDTQSFYKDKTNEYIKLRLEGSQYSDQMIVRFVSDATTGFDAEYDARKLFTNDIPQLYSFSQLENKKIAINSIPEIKEQTELNLGFKAIEGKYNLILEDQNISVNNSIDQIYLYDSYLDTHIDLKKTKTYSFTHEGGEITDRFMLLFQENGLNISTKNIDDIKIYPNPVTNYLNIKVYSYILLKSIEIFDLSGKKCLSDDMASNHVKLNISELNNGIYFVKIKCKNGNIHNEKFIVNK